MHRRSGSLIEEGREKGLRARSVADWQIGGAFTAPSQQAMREAGRGHEILSHAKILVPWSVIRYMRVGSLELLSIDDSHKSHVMLEP